MKLDVKLEGIDDELLYKRVSLKLGKKKVITPTRTNPSTVVNSINEVYNSFKTTTIDNCLNDNKREARKNNEVKRKLTSGLNFYIISYTSPEIPNDKQIEFLADIQYGHSDVVITPTWSQIVRDSKDSQKLLAEYRKLTNTFLDVVETLNNKSIIGMISAKLPRIILKPVIDNYVKRNITSFVLDFDGRSIDSGMSWIRNLMRIVKQDTGFEESFLYSLNPSRGRFTKTAKQILAKDFINTAFGMDVVGLYHIPLRVHLPKMDIPPRIFIKESYGYERIPSKQLTQRGITNTKEYNRNEQYNEKLTLQTKLKEESTIVDYIQSKSQVDEKIITKIKKVKSETT